MELDNTVYVKGFCLDQGEAQFGLSKYPFDRPVFAVVLTGFGETTCVPITGATPIEGGWELTSLFGVKHSFPVLPEDPK